HGPVDWHVPISRVCLGATYRQSVFGNVADLEDAQLFSPCPGVSGEGDEVGELLVTPGAGCLIQRRHLLGFEGNPLVPRAPLAALFERVPSKWRKVHRDLATGCR